MADPIGLDPLVAPSVPLNAIERLLVLNNVDPKKYFDKLQHFVLDLGLSIDKARSQLNSLVKKKKDERISKMDEIERNALLKYTANEYSPDILALYTNNKPQLVNMILNPLISPAIDFVNNLTSKFVNTFDASIGTKTPIAFIYNLGTFKGETTFKAFFKSKLFPLQVFGLTESVKDTKYSSMKEKESVIQGRINDLQTQIRNLGETATSWDNVYYPGNIYQKKVYPIDTSTFSDLKRVPIELFDERKNRWKRLFLRETIEWQKKSFFDMKKELYELGWFNEVDPSALDLSGNDVRENVLVLFDTKIIAPLMELSNAFLEKLDYFEFPLSVEEIKSYIFEYLSIKLQFYREKLSINRPSAYLPKGIKRIGILKKTIELFPDSIDILWVDQWIFDNDLEFITVGVNDEIDADDLKRIKLNNIIFQYFENDEKIWFKKITLKAEEIRKSTGLPLRGNSLSEREFLGRYRHNLKNIEDLLRWQYSVDYLTEKNRPAPLSLASDLSNVEYEPSTRDHLLHFYLDLLYRHATLPADETDQPDEHGDSLAKSVYQNLIYLITFPTPLRKKELEFFNSVAGRIFLQDIIANDDKYDGTVVIRNQTFDRVYAAVTNYYLPSISRTQPYMNGLVSPHILDTSTPEKNSKMISETRKEIESRLRFNKRINDFFKDYERIKYPIQKDFGSMLKNALYDLEEVIRAIGGYKPTKEIPLFIVKKKNDERSIKLKVWISDIPLSDIKYFKYEWKVDYGTGKDPEIIKTDVTTSRNSDLIVDNSDIGDESKYSCIVSGYLEDTVQDIDKVCEGSSATATIQLISKCVRCEKYYSVGENANGGLECLWSINPQAYITHKESMWKKSLEKYKYTFPWIFEMVIHKILANEGIFKKDIPIRRINFIREFLSSQEFKKQDIQALVDDLFVNKQVEKERIKSILGLRSGIFIDQISNLANRGNVSNEEMKEFLRMRLNDTSYIFLLSICQTYLSLHAKTPFTDIEHLSNYFMKDYSYSNMNLSSCFLKSIEEITENYMQYVISAFGKKKQTIMDKDGIDDDVKKELLIATFPDAIKLIRKLRKEKTDEMNPIDISFAKKNYNDNQNIPLQIEEYNEKLQMNEILTQETLSKKSFFKKYNGAPIYQGKHSDISRLPDTFILYYTLIAAEIEENITLNLFEIDVEFLSSFIPKLIEDIKDGTYYVDLDVEPCERIDLTYINMKKMKGDLLMELENIKDDKFTGNLLQFFQSVKRYNSILLGRETS